MCDMIRACCGGFETNPEREEEENLKSSQFVLKETLMSVICLFIFPNADVTFVVIAYRKKKC